ncbi:hypothetical protein P5663_19270 [Priestia flexa]|uniref:hypothetical protein n=1 Tax=Priestia flexa TaxID=86664 RepID=UPI00240E0741|nr:hypothetical protein [Priestia flexa]WEZ08137.1 hypothetical protein P5663_19270 [Priestia flexa]
MNEFIIDYTQQAQMTADHWKRYVIRNKIKECKAQGFSQSQALEKVNRELPIEGINETINLSRVKYYWSESR